MKKLEIILGSIFVTGRILRMWDIPGCGTLTVFSSTFFVLIYWFLPYYILNDKKMQNILKKTTYVGTGVYKTLVSILTGWSLATFVIGVLYVVMYYPWRWVYFINGWVWLVVISIILAIGINAHRNFVINCFKRIIAMAVIGSITILLI